MANADRPKGFEPVGQVLRCTPYVADAVCYPGDVLERTAAGKVQPVSNGATSIPIGVAMSYAAADGDEVLVSDHPDQLYRAQADDADIDAQSQIGLNYDIVATAGDSDYKLSRQEVDSSSGVTTAATPLQLIRIEPRPDNALGANVDCIVRLNMHGLNNEAGTTGVGTDT